MEQINIQTGEQAVMHLGRKLYGEKFSLPDDRKKIYKRIYDLMLLRDGKGLLITGNKGIGKTTCMRIMQKIFIGTPREFKSIDALRMKDLLDDYSLTEIKSLYGGDLKKDLYIDDLGIGQASIKDYGNVINLIGEVLWERDELFYREGFRTHLSTNLKTALPPENPEMTLAKMYGDRIYDRIKGMTVLIEWPGESLRGKK